MIKSARFILFCIHFYSKIICNFFDPRVISDPLPPRKNSRILVSTDVSWHSVSISVKKKNSDFFRPRWTRYLQGQLTQVFKKFENSRNCTALEKSRKGILSHKKKSIWSVDLVSQTQECGSVLLLKSMAWIVRSNRNFKLTFSKGKECICEIFQKLYYCVSFRIS